VHSPDQDRASVTEGRLQPLLFVFVLKHHPRIKLYRHDVNFLSTGFLYKDFSFFPSGPNEALRYVRAAGFGSWLWGALSSGIFQIFVF